MARMLGTGIQAQATVGEDKAFLAKVMLTVCVSTDSQECFSAIKNPR